MTTPSLPVKVVVDASIVAKWLITEPDSPQARKLLAQGLDLVAPDLLYAEVANALCKRARSGALAQADVDSMIQWLIGRPLDIRPSAPLLPAASSIAHLYDRSVYDSLYIALALREQTVLVTGDQRLLSALAATPLSSVLVPVATL